MTYIADRVARLRAKMQDNEIDYYFVPSSDPHFNEYLPKCWERRAWISGFTGSAGDVLIGLDEAVLWTDGRYTIQAEEQLDASIFGVSTRPQGPTDLAQWVLEQNRPLCLGVDPSVISVAQFQALEKAISCVHGRLRLIEDNLIDQVNPDYDGPILSSNIIAHDVKYAGQSTEAKLSAVREKMNEAQVNALVLTALDEIAWLLNVRGEDIVYNPLVISYLIVTQSDVTWFVGESRIAEAGLSSYCDSYGIRVKGYDAFYPSLTELAGQVWLDSHTANYAVLKNLSDCEPFFDVSPIQMMKAIKNPVEAAGAVEAHKLDAVALIKFIHWLKSEGHTGQTEVSLQQKLLSCRQEEPKFKGNSFNTICGFGPHSAVIHYAASDETNAKVDASSLLLIDSGGQYFEGTTDITRTFHLGEPTAEQKKHYTLVLKGHLALRRAVFPENTTGAHLDVLARQFLWQEGLSFRHGTGHGVGSYLCVHEGPQVVSPGLRKVPLQPGMIISNEPGVYFKGRYGIRIENLVAVEAVSDERLVASEYGPFYHLKDLTLVPYERKLIDLSLLSQEERDQVNHYHQQVFDAISPLLPDALHAFLREETAPI